MKADRLISTVLYNATSDGTSYLPKKNAKKKYKRSNSNQIESKRKPNQTKTSSIEGQLLLRRFLTLIKKRLRLYLQFENVSCFLKELYILGSWP